MNAGLFDLPGPLFRAADLALSPLPAAARLVLWALFAAAVSMWLYKLLSPQRKLAAAETEALEARHELNDFEGEMDEAWPLIARMLKASGRRLRLALLPALIASFPIVALIVWLSNDYGYRYPEPWEETAIRTTPAGFDATLDGGEGEAREILLGAAEDEPQARIPFPAPVPIIEEYKWWNWLIANPAGYLPETSPVERIEIALPQVEIQPYGPSWARGWELLFFCFFLVFSLIIKRAGKIA